MIAERAEPDWIIWDEVDPPRLDSERFRAALDRQVARLRGEPHLTMEALERKFDEIEQVEMDHWADLRRGYYRRGAGIQNPEAAR